MSDDDVDLVELSAKAELLAEATGRDKSDVLADLLDDGKFKNNKLMDQLVEQLGYLDYRDALAANKYILQTKAAGE